MKFRPEYFRAVHPQQLGQYKQQQHRIDSSPVGRIFFYFEQKEKDGRRNNSCPSADIISRPRIPRHDKYSASRKEKKISLPGGRERGFRWLDAHASRSVPLEPFR